MALKNILINFTYLEGSDSMTGSSHFLTIELIILLQLTPEVDNVSQ